MRGTPSSDPNSDPNSVPNSAPSLLSRTLLDLVPSRRRRCLNSRHHCPARPGPGALAVTAKAVELRHPPGSAESSTFISASAASTAAHPRRRPAPSTMPPPPPPPPPDRSRSGPVRRRRPQPPSAPRPPPGPPRHAGPPPPPRSPAAAPHQSLPPVVGPARISASGRARRRTGWRGETRRLSGRQRPARLPAAAAAAVPCRAPAWRPDASAVVQPSAAGFSPVGQIASVGLAAAVGRLQRAVGRVAEVLRWPRSRLAGAVASYRFAAAADDADGQGRAGARVGGAGRSAGSRGARPRRR